MIEINLIAKKKGGKPVVVLGVDVRTINFKMFGLAILIFYLPKNYLAGVWQKELEEVDRTIAKLDAEATTAQEELKSYDNVKLELEAYNNQIEKLRGRSEQVDTILKEKTSPRRVLERIARSLPEDMWVDELLIKEDRSFELRGGAEKYKSIGDMITTLNETPYFANSLNLVKSETKVEIEGGREIRTESYNIGGIIKTFEIMGR